MTTGRLLSTRDIAEERGIEKASVARGLAESRRRLRAGLPLRPRDLPVPDDADAVYGYPRWRRTAELEAWLGRPGQPPRVNQSAGKDES